MNTNPTDNASIKGLRIDIPTLPHTLLMAMGLSREADRVSIDEVARVIENDPAAVARVLRMVNSAYYALRNEVTNVRRAVVALGPESVLSIVMSMCLIDLKGNLAVVTNDAFQRLVRHSIATGYLARQLVSMSRLAYEANSDRADFLGEAFTLGLLHDFGKIVLLYNYPDQAAALYDEPPPADTPAEVLLAGERAAFGFDHVQAGEHLMHELHFLDFMVEVVARHHDWTAAADLDPSVRRLVYFVVAGNNLANALGFELDHKISREAMEGDVFWDVFLEENLIETRDRDTFFQDVAKLERMTGAYVHEVM